MKKFVTEFGRGLIDLFAVIVLIGIVVMSLDAFHSSNPASGITILVVGMIVFILTFYLLYLLIDIKDNTSSINNLLTEYLKGEASEVIHLDENKVSTRRNNSSKKIKYPSENHTVTCQKCGQEFNVIGKDDALCPQCGFLYKNNQ